MAGVGRRGVGGERAALRLRHGHHLRRLAADHEGVPHRSCRSPALRAVNIAAWLFAWRLLPELTGHRLEDIVEAPARWPVPARGLRGSGVAERRVSAATPASAQTPPV